MDRFSDLELFLSISRRQSFKGAAQDLGVTSSAISQRLAALEKRLGASLIQRTTRSIKLTPEGERYFENGLSILNALDNLEDSIGKATNSPKGLLRVNASFGFGRNVVAPLLSLFKKQFPDVEIQLHLTDQPVDLVAEGFDVGIRVGGLQDKRYVAKKLLVNQQKLCASPEYLNKVGKITDLKDLYGCQAIMLREDDNIFGSWHLQCRNKVETVKIGAAMSTNDGEVALQWALCGFGLLLRSEWSIQPYLNQGRLSLVLPDWSVTADVYAVYPTRKNLNTRTRAFVNFLAEQLKGKRKLSTLFSDGEFSSTKAS